MKFLDFMKSFFYQVTKPSTSWARLLFPILLGGILIAIVVHIMYFGGKRESLVAQAESSMIRWSLAYAERPATASSKNIAIISVVDGDLAAIQKAKNEQLIDASIEEYASVLEHVAASDPEWIVLSWLTYAQPITPEYLKPITDVINRLQIHKKVTIAINLYASGTIAPEYIRSYNIVEARDCYYDVNSFCTNSKDWTWMPQQIMNRYFKNPPKWTVTTNLPHTLPNLLLNIPTISSLKRHSFLDFSPPVMSEIPPKSIVFIGNETSQSLLFRDNKDALQRTYVPGSFPRRSLNKDGIPWHAFWAGMTSMFLEDQTIAVVPEWISWIAIGLMTITILISIKILGGTALIPFFFCAISLPIANMFMVSRLHVYLPVMPVVVAGLVVFTAATFISVAFSSYTKWKLQAAEDLAENTTDIKQNFIHLISHNLNTPIAQLHGLLDLMSAQLPNEVRIHQASKILEFIRITVRAVLNTSTMRNQNLRVNRHSLRSFIERFHDRESGFFKRTTLNIKFYPSEDDESGGEIWFFKFDFDEEMVSLCILYTAVLLSIQLKTNFIQCHLSSLSEEPADPQGLILTFKSSESALVDPVSRPEFVQRAIKEFLNMVTERGLVQIEYQNESIKLIFPQ